MYASEKYVKMEVRQLQSTISEVVSDLSGDIIFLNTELTAAKEAIKILTMQIEELKNNAK